MLVKGRVEEARAVLARIARGNGSQLPKCELKSVTTLQSSETISIKDLLRGKIIRHRTVVLIVAWYVDVLCISSKTLTSTSIVATAKNIQYYPLTISLILLLISL